MGSLMGGGSSGNTGGTTRIRYADYIESAHDSNIRVAQSWNDALRNESPYEDFESLDYNDAIYGVGYSMSNYISMYEAFGKYIDDIDTDTMFDSMFSQVVSTDTIRELTSSHSDLLDDDIEQTALPRFKAGMRDINSVMSSSFIIGSAIIEQGKVKALSEFSAKLKYNLISVSVNVFNSTLSWNQNAVSAYLDILRYSMAMKVDETKLNYELLVKDTLWPFTVISHDQSITGSLQGAMNQTTDNAKISTASSVVGGAMTGAAAGALVASGPGAVVGGILGGLGGLIG